MTGAHIQSVSQLQQRVVEECHDHQRERLAAMPLGHVASTSLIHLRAATDICQAFFQGGDAADPDGVVPAKSPKTILEGAPARLTTERIEGKLAADG